MSRMIGDMTGNIFEEDDAALPLGPPSHKRLPLTPEAQPRGASGFVGLQNQGMTCYLNSLLQTMFLTPELRAGLYQVPLADLGLNAEELQPEPAKEVTESGTGLDVLTGMGFPPHRARLALKRCRNDVEKAADWLVNQPASEEKADSGNELPPLESPEDETSGANGMSVEEPEVQDGGNERAESTAPQVAGSEADAAPKPKRRRRGLIRELQKAFAWLQAVDQKAISTEDLTKVFGWEGSQAREQHDVHELNRILFDGIEHYMKGTKQESLVKNLYHGMLVNQVECLKCGTVSERQEEFSDIPVVVKGFSSLEESLAAAAKAEMLDGDNQYFCECCQTKVDAKRSQRLRSLPPLLTLPLCRFEYDWTQDERRKITTPFSFPLTLNLAPYIAPPATSEQSERSANGSSSNPPEPLLYDLLSVVIHSGSAHSGHYHAYIRDMLREGKGQLEADTISRGFEAADGAEGRVHGGMLLEGAGLNEGLEHAGSAMDALVEAAVQETERERGTESPTMKTEAEERNGEASISGEEEDEPEYGHWYDFNDSNVSAVHWSAITRQFGGGNECAYMLTFRQRLPKGQIIAAPALDAITEAHREEGASNGLSTSRDSENVTIVAQKALAVPEHLAPLVSRRNEQLQEERRIAEESAAREAAEQEAARKANEVKLFLHLPEDGSFVDGRFYSQYEDPSEMGRVLKLERSSTVAQLAHMVAFKLHLVDKFSVSLYIVSPKIDTVDFEEPAEGREADSITQDIVLDEEEVKAQEDVQMSDAVSELDKLTDEHAEEQLERMKVDPPQRRLVFENGPDEKAELRERRNGSRVPTSSSGSSADSRTRGVKRAAEGGKSQLRGGKFHPEIIRGPQLLEFEDPPDGQTSSESERRSAGGVLAEGSGLSASGSAGGGLWEAPGLSAMDLNSTGEVEPEKMQEQSSASAERPTVRKLKRTVYAVTGRFNRADYGRRLEDQIQNGGGVLVWSNTAAPPPGVTVAEEDTNYDADVGETRNGDASSAWLPTVNNGWEVQPTGWGSSTVLSSFTVKIADRLLADNNVTYTVKVAPNTSVWMLKSEALSMRRLHCARLLPEQLGEDDVTLVRLTGGGFGEALSDDTIAAGLLTSGEKLHLVPRSPDMDPPLLRFAVNVYGKQGLVASQKPLEMPRSALLVELVAAVNELGAAAIRESSGVESLEEVKLSMRQEGSREPMRVDEENMLKTIEELGFRGGDELYVMEEDAWSPDCLSIRVHRYVLPHERSADEVRAKFLASAMASVSTPMGPPTAEEAAQAPPAMDQQTITAQADSLAQALTAALTAQKRAAGPSRHMRMQQPKRGRGLGRGLGAGLSRSRARLQELAPGVLTSLNVNVKKGGSGEVSESPYALAGLEGRPRLPRRLQRSMSSSRGSAPPKSAQTAAASSLRFQEPGVPAWCFSVAGDVVISKHATLQELKQKILALPAFARDKIAPPLRTRMRELKEPSGLGKEYRDLQAELSKLGFENGKPVAVRILSSEDALPEGAPLPSSDCESLPELIDVLDNSGGEGSGGSTGAREEPHLSGGGQQTADDVAMEESSAELHLDPTWQQGGGVELPTSSGSGTSGWVQRQKAEPASTSMEVEVGGGDDRGDEADSSQGLPNPGDLGNLSDPRGERKARSPFQPFRRRVGPSRHALVLTVQRRVPLPPEHIPPVPQNLARRAAQALGPSTLGPGGSKPVAEPVVSPYFQSDTPPAGSERGPLPSPVPQTIPLPHYLEPQNDSGLVAPPPLPTSSLPLSDASLGFAPMSMKRTPPLQNGPATPPSAHFPTTPVDDAPQSRERELGMQALMHVAAHLQKQTGSTPANLQFLHHTAPPPLPDPPRMKRQFAFTSPEEVSIDLGRASLTAAELKAFLGGHFGIPIQRLRVIKVDGARLRVLHEDERPQDEAANQRSMPGPGDSSEALSSAPLGKPEEGRRPFRSGKGTSRPSNSRLQSSVNVKQKILQLQDGDTLVVMDASDDLDCDDQWCAGSVGPSGDWRTKMGPPALNTSWGTVAKGPSLGPTEKKQRRPEAALRIRMDEFD